MKGGFVLVATAWLGCTPGPTPTTVAQVENRGTTPPATATTVGAAADGLIADLRELVGPLARVERLHDVRLGGSMWPDGDYAIVSVAPERPGVLRLGYHFERRRADGDTEVVERVFEVTVVPDGETPVVVLDHPFAQAMRLGDRIELPVPLNDPWGELGEVRWDRFEIGPPSQERFEPPICTSTAAPSPPPVPQIVDVEVLCYDVLLANLKTRTDYWLRAVAGADGKVPGLPVEVRAESRPFTMRPRFWQERSRTGTSTSAGTKVVRDTVAMLRPGDVLMWQPPSAGP